MRSPSTQPVFVNGFAARKAGLVFTPISPVLELEIAGVSVWLLIAAIIQGRAARVYRFSQNLFDGPKQAHGLRPREFATFGVNAGQVQRFVSVDVAQTCHRFL